MGKKKQAEAGHISFKQLYEAYDTGIVKPGQEVFAFTPSISGFYFFRGTLVSVIEETSRDPAHGQNPVTLENTVSCEVRTGTPGNKVASQETLTIYNSPKGTKVDYFLSPATLAKDLEGGSKLKKSEIAQVLSGLGVQPVYTK